VSRRVWIAIGLVALLAFMFALPSILNNLYWTHVLVLSTITALMAVSLRTLARTGLIYMGTAGFMLTGAYTSAILVVKAGFAVWPAMFLGALMAATIALVVGIPFLRAKGIYFAILTVMMSEVLRNIVWYWNSLTGGSTGLRGIPEPEPINLGVATLSFDTRANYYYLALVLVVICLIILYRVEKSWLGNMWTAINENDLLARSVGIHIKSHKLLVFTITAFFTGFAGALYAHYMGTLSPYGYPGSPFSFTASVYTIMYMMVGGEAYFAGPIVGAFLLTFVPELSRGVQEYLPIIFGALIIFIVFVMPEGLLGLLHAIVRRVKRVYGKNKAGPAPAVTPVVEQEVGERNE
jgi:branched-chain amino acid transport system permease protein